MVEHVMADDETSDIEDFSRGALQLSNQERHILDFWDRLEEIRLESSYVGCLLALPDIEVGAVSDEDVENAKRELLEAKALYTLRNTIEQNILIANPILKAVHAGANASVVERDLLPLIQARDEVSISLTNVAAKILSSREILTKKEVEHAGIVQKNIRLAATMTALAEEVDGRKKEDIEDPKVRARLGVLEEELRVSRQRWRLMKGTAGAIVAGSGMDWVRDAALRQIVLDGEDDED